MTFRPPVICVDRVVLWNQKRVVRVTALPILGLDNERLGHPVLLDFKHVLPPLPWCLLYHFLSGRNVGDFSGGYGVDGDGGMG
jgi:hypothetical protein